MLLGGLALGAPQRAEAQATTAVTQPSRTQEFGIDAGAVFGVGDQSSVAISLPGSRARVGFFFSDESRWSLEPAVGLNYGKVEGGDGNLIYNLELGALYHFRPNQDLIPDRPDAVRSSVAYVRPFVNLTGFTGGDGDTEVSAGAGVGLKVPWRPQVAWRMEANLGYGFDNEALRIGALVGLSFFTRNVIR